MYKYLPITDVYAREILDSRGNPTIEWKYLPEMNSAEEQVFRPVHRPENMKQLNYGIKKNDMEDWACSRRQIMSMQGLRRK